MNTTAHRKKRKKRNAKAKTDKKKNEVDPEKIYSDRHTVFIDILGFKSLVEKSVDNPSLRKAIHDLLHFDHTHARNSLFSNPLKNTDGRVATPSDIQSTSFSDSVVISFDAASESETVLLYLCDLSCSLIASDFFVRGGISSGQVFHEGSVIFGPAMNKAYELENSAIYPRIVVDPELVYAFNSTIRFQLPRADQEDLLVYEFHPLIQDISDGAYILNVVDYALACAHREAQNEKYRVSQKLDCSDPNFGRWRSWPFVVKEKVERNLSRFKIDSKESRKYVWFASHFNRIYLGPNNPSMTKFTNPPGPVRKPGDGSVTTTHTFGAPIAAPTPPVPDSSSPNPEPEKDQSQLP